ncbi:flavodoxin family protein [Acetonema longum]|uniref:Multimeric flavodoxin WrbA-like protein n=1 Tax=Acetonema longum DSM 6540 TaxID=1009370 RepID=F7NK29_9FIRM|nr:flavodoxin family protein [Acetonema longum]EGO63470.1 multimeric flavodoxin WrbA-like protein [Acetonema longum DSM 6540]
MKALALVASPRKLGNSEILAKEMLASLPAAERRMIRLTDLRIEQCRACYACLPAEKDCVIKDDMTFLLREIRWADAVIISSACYFLGPHTSIKTIGDRLISVLQEGSRYAGKKCATVLTYGVPGWEGYGREAVRNFAGFLHLDVVGSLTVQAANPGTAIKPAILEEARKLAERLIPGQAGVTPRPDCCCPACGSSLLQLKPTGDIRCVMCNCTGRITAADAGIALRFVPSGHPRFSAAGMAEHGRLLEGIKDDYIASRKELSVVRKNYQQHDSWWIKPDAGINE